jgi:hypothetical protein
VTYPPELSDVPPFADWLKERVEHALRSGQHLDEDVIQYACPPERYATSHRQMYSYGMHLRVRSSEGGLVTRDSCVVATFTQQLRWGIRNGRPIERTAEHVGFIEEILELDYRNHCTTILLCEWVKPTSNVRVPNIERDRYGFTVANFNHMDSRVHADSFAFPLHCQQVFLSDDPSRRGWKVVLRTDVRVDVWQYNMDILLPASLLWETTRTSVDYNLEYKKQNRYMDLPPRAARTLRWQQTQRHKTPRKRNEQ